MTEIVFTDPRPSLDDAPAGLRDCPGRNDPRYGAWMLFNLVPGVAEPVVADPMCGGGQLWMQRRPGTRVYGCELVVERAMIAEQNGVIAAAGTAETWRPPVEPVDLVAFSPPYPNCDHNSGTTAHQRDLVASKGLQAMQAIEQVPCLWRVFAQVATYRGAAPVAVIVRDYVRDQSTVRWSEEVAAAMTLAGLGSVEWFYRMVPPGPTEQWKLARGEFNARTGQKHRVVDRELVLVARAA